jgi:methionine-rich copper-binding protein CopC
MRKLFVLVLLAAMFIAVEAAAHAYLERSSPAAGAAGKAPAEIRLWFSERLEPRFSRARLAAADGSAIAASATVSGKQIVLRVPRLAPGTYRVTWSIVSVDTHKTEGSFSFEVRP